MLNTLRYRLLSISCPTALTLAGTLLTINVLAILFGVFARYIAGGAPIWTDELSRFLIIGTVMLGAGAVWAEGGHMRVGLLEKLMPAPLARVLIVYQWILTLIIALGAAWFSYRYALSVNMFTTSGLGISRSIPLMALPAGFLLLAWHVLLYGPAPLKTVEDQL